VRREHDLQVQRLLDWLTSRSGRHAVDPVQEAEDLAWRLSRRKRFEEAQRTHKALEDLLGVRRSYTALAEACSLRFAVLSQLDMNGDGAGVRLNLVWNGRLSEPISLRPVTLREDVEKALAACRRSGPDRASETTPVAVCQAEVDRLLAVRRWFREAKRPENPATVVLTATGPAQLEPDVWRDQLVAATLRMLGESAT
jgi:hypothetical protein